MTVAGQTSRLDANEIWEFLFNRTKDAVPEELTNEILADLAAHINKLWIDPLTELQHRREAEDDARKKIHRLHAEYAGHRDALPIDSLDRRFAQVCVELTSDILRMFPQADAPNSALGEHP